MMKHSFKLIWNQKSKNIYVILELFFLFIILIISSVYLLERYEQYSGGSGADINDTFFLRIVKKDGARANYSERLLTMKNDIRSLENVEEVSYSRHAIPYTWYMSMNTMTYDSTNVGTVLRYVDENFVRVFRIKMIAGEWFRDDYDGAYPPIVIDKLAAEKLLESPENAIGKVVIQSKEFVVVGVYDKLKSNEYEDNYPSCFIPCMKSESSIIDMVVRYKEGSIPETSKLARIVFNYFDKNEFAIQFASTMEAKKREAVAETNIQVTMVSFFSVFLIINMILGMIGIFGYNVKRRTSELGIRRALGSSAQKLHILLLFESWSLTILALIPAILLVIQIPILKLYPVETDIFIKSVFLSVFMIFLLVSISVLYPALLASKTQAAQALQEE